MTLEEKMIKGEIIMTTEEKAKAYDEALKQAKFYHGNCPSEPERKKLEKMFPVLHESEVERIRKSLIEYFKRFRPTDMWDSQSSFEQVVAYLEKQKDASKAIEAVERIDKYIDAHTANAHDMDDSNPDKKYYQGQDDALGKIAGILQDVYTEKKEQKPAKEVDNLHNYLYGDNEKSQEWSEEDEKIWLKSLPLNFKKKNEDIAKLCSNEWSEEDGETLEDIIRSVTGFDATTGIISQNFKQHEKKINFLKSLRSQPKQEWSEEDKSILDEAIAMIEARGCWIRSEDAVKRVSDFLKSLPEKINLLPKQEWRYPYGENETVDKLMAIAECLETDGDCTFNGHTGKVCGKFLRELARKQIESKPAEWNPTNEDVILFNKAITTNTALTPAERAKLDIIRMKFKHCNGNIANSTEWSEDDKKMLDNAIHACLDVYGTMSETANWLKTHLKSLRPQPKQEWSEGDERLLNLIIDILDREEHNEHITHNELIMCVRLLKSLRPQSKQEWSEEDKQALQYSIDWLSTYRDRHAMTQDAKDDITFCIEKLKTLRPQPNWKPSKKQINMLRVIVEREKEKPLYGIDGYSPAAVLESLYNDLKKLMEE